MNGQSYSTDLEVTASAVRAMLDGERLDDVWNMERFGAYHDLMNRLLVASVGGPAILEQLWRQEAQSAPALAAYVDGQILEGVVHVSEVMDALRQWYMDGSPKGLSPGWRSLERIYRVMPGEVTLLVGTPSAGKTHLISQMITNMASQHRWRIAIYSPEQGTPARHLRLLLMQCVGRPFDKGRPNRMDWSEAESVLRWLNDRLVFLAPRLEMPTVQYILDIALTEVHTRGLQGLVIDPWNRVAHQRPDGMLETDYIGQSLVRIARFSADHQVHTWIIAHPTKVFTTDGKFPVITPNMIAGSAHWWNMPDNILSLYRDLSKPNESTVQIHTQKIRFDESGIMGRMVELHYDAETGKYSELARGR
jgi:twinkle protein